MAVVRLEHIDFVSMPSPDPGALGSRKHAAAADPPLQKTGFQPGRSGEELNQDRG
jgi:hypothetical protein